MKIKKGFTLIELLIVISIIGILATILISMINPFAQRRKAYGAEAQTNLSRLAQAGESYAAEFGNYGDCNSDWKTEGYLRYDRPASSAEITYSYNCIGTAGAAENFCFQAVIKGGKTFRYYTNDGKVTQAACP